VKILRLFLALFSLIPLTACAEEASAFTELFNGRDLTDWNIVGPANLAPIVVEGGRDRAAPFSSPNNATPTSF
jgi:hypothetical protein